jgi:hypothetical protein
VWIVQGVATVSRDEMPVIDFLQELAAAAEEGKQPHHTSFGAVVFLFFNDRILFDNILLTLHNCRVSRCSIGCRKSRNVEYLCEEILYACDMVYTRLRDPNEVTILQCLQVLHYTLVRIWEDQHLWSYQGLVENSEMDEEIIPCAENIARMTFQLQANFPGWEVSFYDAVLFTSRPIYSV